MSRNSEIFDNYVKIALERGIVKKAESNAKKTLDNNPRASAQNVSAIEALYGVKPDAHTSMEYKNNIMEVAHPNSVILSPAHDKINGLLENNIERQNIMLNIVNQPSHGNLTHKKYAESELLHSLLRVATDMDNRDNKELRVLADACAEQLKKQADWKSTLEDFFKERGSDALETGKGVGGGAVIGTLLGGLIGAFFGGAGALPGAVAGGKIGAFMGGVIAALSKTSPQAKNVSVNAADTRAQLSDLIKKFPNNNFLLSFDQELRKLIELSDNYSKLTDAAVNNPASNASSSEQVTKDYIDQMERIKILAVKFKSTTGQFEDKLDWASKLKTPVHWFMDDDVEDVEDSLNALLITINKAEIGINEFKSSAAKAASQQTQAPTATPVATHKDQEKIQYYLQQLKNLGVDVK